MLKNRRNSKNSHSSKENESCKEEIVNDISTKFGADLCVEDLEETKEKLSNKFNALRFPPS